MKTQLIPPEGCTPRTPSRTEPRQVDEPSSNPSWLHYSLSFPQTAIGSGGPLTARAAANIAEWSTYLPQDCVEAMIRDGWHLTV